MKIDYAIVGLVASLLYALIRELLPDFPISDVAFQGLIFYILVKLGVNVEPSKVVGEVYNKYFGKPVAPKTKSKKG